MSLLKTQKDSTLLAELLKMKCNSWTALDRCRRNMCSKIATDQITSHAVVLFCHQFTWVKDYLTSSLNP